MADEELVFETVAGLASLIERREVSPVAPVEAYLERIDRLNDQLHAYITVCRESALAEARTAEKEIANGRYQGPLHGDPYWPEGPVLDEGRSHYRRLQNPLRADAG